MHEKYTPGCWKTSTEGKVRDRGEDTSSAIASQYLATSFTQAKGPRQNRRGQLVAIAGFQGSDPGSFNTKPPCQGPLAPIRFLSEPSHGAQGLGRGGWRRTLKVQPESWNGRVKPVGRTIAVQPLYKCWIRGKLKVSQHLLCCCLVWVAGFRARSLCDYRFQGHALSIQNWHSST